MVFFAFHNTNIEYLSALYPYQLLLAFQQMCTEKCKEILFVKKATVCELPCYSKRAWYVENMWRLCIFLLNLTTKSKTTSHARPISVVAELALGLVAMAAASQGQGRFPGYSDFASSQLEQLAMYGGAVSVDPADMFTGNRGGPYTCKLCGKSVKYAGNFRRHLMLHTHDTAAPMFTCQLCPYTSSTKANLENHMMKRHTGDKPYRCDKCDALFTNPKNLAKHMKSCPGEKSDSKDK